MFMQNSGNLNNMEFCANKLSRNSWGFIQNCVPVESKPAWAHSALSSIDEKRSNINQNNTFTQPVSATNSDLWRKEASIADWESYLYSKTPNPVNITQCQPISDSSNASNNPVSSESWRKETSIADWEAYLYSRTSIPVNKVTQIPDFGRSSVVPRSPIVYASPNTSHRAHISFVHTNGVLKPIVKRKRKRTAFTTEQVETLERVFYKRPYVSKEEREILTDKLQVSDKAIKVWFQNRRLKVKKEKEEQELDSSDSETVDIQDAKPLAYVEAQMYKADEFGYVTLDDRAINELVTVIDEFLPKDADLGNTNSEKTRHCSVSESESSAIYEPISPPDFTDSASQDGLNQKWERFEAIEPKKSLQNLLDVHYMCNCEDSCLSVF